MPNGPDNPFPCNKSMRIHGSCEPTHSRHERTRAADEPKPTLGPWSRVRAPKASQPRFLLHVLALAYVYPFVRLGLSIGLLAVSAFASDPALDSLLKGVETRYNQAKSLQVLFHEDYTPLGRPRRSESGTLLLRKPGKMRWDYDQPKGKLFLSDGKWVWLYTPADNRAEKMKLQVTEDLRAPLAFLLGKLNFQKDFRNLQATPEGSARRISAEPKTDNLPYSAVEFVVNPDSRITFVKVTGYDRSILEFHFDDEKMDPKLDAKLFVFELPKGAELVEEGH
jgi:outer membrane lipoprotein carrier protein